MLPVTPVRVAIEPNSSSWLTPSAFAIGMTLPIDVESSGNVVCPSLTVVKARSDAFVVAASLVSP